MARYTERWSRIDNFVKDHKVLSIFLFLLTAPIATFVAIFVHPRGMVQGEDEPSGVLTSGVIGLFFVAVATLAWCLAIYGVYYLLAGSSGGAVPQCG